MKSGIWIRSLSMEPSELEGNLVNDLYQKKGAAFILNVRRYANFHHIPQDHFLPAIAQVVAEEDAEENLKLTELCEKASVTIQTLVKEHELRS